MSVLRLLSVGKLPIEDIYAQLADSKNVVVVEEVCAGSGIGSVLASELSQKDPACRVYKIDLGNTYVTHGSVEKLYKHYGLDAESIVNYVTEVLRVEN